MKLFTDFEFTLVTQRSFAECAETVRQIGLYSELLGGKVKNKDAGAGDGRHFAYKYRKALTILSVTGTLIPYEQPYSGCRVEVCMSEGTSNNAVNRFVFYVILPLFFMLCVFQQEYEIATGTAGIAAFVIAKWLYLDRPNCLRTQELLVQLFHAAVEQPRTEHREDV
jgi:hypothetical protein